MDLVWHIPGEEQGRIICASVDAGPQAASHILARAASFLRENVKAKGPALLFSGGALGLAIQAAWDTESLGPLFVAVASPAQGEKARALRNGIVLDEVGPGFVDRLKMETRGEGFRTVMVATARGEAVREALGAAAVFGHVLLLITAKDLARADLHSTINYKSLNVTGADPFAGSEAARAPADRSTAECRSDPFVVHLGLALLPPAPDGEGDHFEIAGGGSAGSARIGDEG